MWKIAARQLRNTPPPPWDRDDSWDCLSWRQLQSSPFALGGRLNQEKFGLTEGFALGRAFLLLIRITDGVIIQHAVSDYLDGLRRHQLGVLLLSVHEEEIFFKYRGLQWHSRTMFDDKENTARFPFSTSAVNSHRLSHQHRAAAEEPWSRKWAAARQSAPPNM